MQHYDSVVQFLKTQGFSTTKATRIAREARRHFRIEEANVLLALRLESQDGWTIVDLDSNGRVTFGALKQALVDAKN